MTSIFSDNVNSKIKHFLTRYETRRSAILPVLHLIQDEYGWVEEKHMEALEKEYDLDRVQVLEVFTFYTAYHKKKPAKFHIQFCDNIVCEMQGAKNIIKKIDGYIEKLGPTSEFGCIGVPCLGLCGHAPVMLVNKDRYGDVSIENIEKTLEKYSSLPKESH